LPGDDVDGEDEAEAECEGDVKEESEKNATDSGYNSSGTRTPESDLVDLTPADEKVELPLPTPAPESPLLLTSLSTKAKILPPPVYVGNSHRARAPILTRRQVSDLATSFATSLPEQREFSMAALQGYLMAYKTRPYEAVKDVAKWVEKERLDKAEKMKVGTQAKVRTAEALATETKVAQVAA
jgi:chaperone BCS1